MKTKIRIVSQFCILALAVGAMSLAGATRAETTPTGEGSSLSAKDKIFMKKAAKGGMMEVAMGRVAEENATDSEVKKFGARMVKDHEKDLAEFKEEASSGSDPDLKKFADDTAKIVQEHLDLAKETQGKLK